MNYGIINNRRPEKEKSNSPFLADPRMREIAKQMGLDAKDFGKEAQNIWSMLDDMAENDPTSYQDFIKEQLKDGPPASKSTQSSSEDEDGARFFTPIVGFVIKCTLAKENQKLFLNICSHELVDLPKNPNSGREVPRDTRKVPNTSNLQIPLVIGTPRMLKDALGATCQAIDVVFHPWVLERCEWDANFKRDVMKLALHWVQEDAKLSLKSPSAGKFIKSKYKGGVTIGNEIVTAKFYINGPTNKQKSGDKQSQKSNQTATANNSSSNSMSHVQITDSPADLLKRMTLLSDDNQVETLPLQLPSLQNKTETDSKKKKKKVLIEEVHENTSNSDNQKHEIKAEIKKESSKKNTKRSSVVKRGFLNATKKPLYPKGSEEGREASSYVKLLSRSKVVDLGEAQEQEKQQRQQREALARERDEALAFLKPLSKSNEVSTADPTEIDHYDHEFDSLCKEADPDFEPVLSASRKRSKGDEHSLLGPQFQDFAKLLGA